MTDIYLVPPPYGYAVIGRGLRITRQVEEKDSATGWHPKNITDARWSYEVRAWDERDDTAHIVRQAVTKGADAVNGWIDGYVDLPSTAHEVLLWELIEIDSGGADADTPSGLRELVIERWRQPIGTSTQMGATNP